MSTLPSTTDLILGISLVIALVPMALCYLARWWLHRGTVEPVWMFPLLMTLGGVGGFFVPLFAHEEVVRVFALIYESDLLSRPLFVNSVAAPTGEELGKALVLLPLVFTRWYRSPVDGLLYGFAAGAGFACAENFVFFTSAYVTGGGVSWIASVVGRTGPAAIIHGCATACVGAAIGAARFDGRRTTAVLGPICGFVAAVLIHGTWNLLLECAAITGDIWFEQVAYLGLPFVGLGFVWALSIADRVESTAIEKALQAIHEKGHINTGEFSAIVDRERRKGQDWAGDKDRKRFLGTALELGLALRRLRREGRGRSHVKQLHTQLEELTGRPAPHLTDPAIELPEEER